MITNEQLAAGAVTLTKLSKNLCLPHVNLAKGNMAGEVLLAAANGDLVSKRLRGAVVVEHTGVVALELGHLYNQLRKLGVVFQEDFTRPNTMLYAKRAGQPKALDLNELKIQLGIPNTFSSSELDVAYTGTGGGGGLVKIKSFTDLEGANPFVIDGFSDAYDTYKLVCHNAMSTGSSTSDLGMRFVYGSTVISTDNYEFSRTLDTAETDWHSTSDSTRYGAKLICVEDDHPGTFSIDIFNTRDTSKSAVLYSGLGTSNHGGSLAQYIPLGAMEWAGGIAAADRKVDAIYLYPLTASAVEAAGASKIKGKFTLYGFKK